MILLGLVCVRDGEISERMVERGIIADVAGDLRRLAGLGVSTSEGPAAELPPDLEILRGHRRDDGSALLVLELTNI